MQIECRSCGEVVPADHLNLERLVAKCAACHAVFRFQLDGEPAPAPPGRARADVAQPDKVTVEDHGRELVITTRWRSGCAIAFLLPFALVWNGFVWGVHLFAIDDDLWFARWFLVPFQLVGLGLFYLLLGVIVNRTTVTVDDRTVRVKHQPLPFPSGTELAVADIEQLFVRERISTSTSNNGSRSVRVNHSVEAVLRGGRRVPLLRQVGDVDTALWFEQVLEQRLGIVDRAVRGEV